MNLIFSDRSEPSYHLAIEEYLFYRTKEEYVLLYINSPCVVIGSNQIYGNEVNEFFCEEHQIPVFRRMSGGGAVYHDPGNLNYSFILNRGEKGSALDGSFLQPVIGALSAMGIPVEKGARKDLWLPDGFKISGTASHLNSDRAMHHGTLLYDTDLYLLETVLRSGNKIPGKGTASVPSPVKNMRTFLQEHALPHPDMNDFCMAFTGELQKLFDFTSVLHRLPPASRIEIDNLQRNKYQSSDWNKKK